MRQINSPLAHLLQRIRAVPDGQAMPFCLTGAAPRESEFIAFLIALDLVLEYFNIVEPNPNDEACLGRAEGIAVAAYEGAAAALKFYGNVALAMFFAGLAKTGIKAFSGTDTPNCQKSFVNIVDSFGGQILACAARDAANATRQRRVTCLNRAPDNPIPRPTLVATDTPA
jgi:hypothetical protein